MGMTQGAKLTALIAIAGALVFAGSPARSQEPAAQSGIIAHGHGEVNAKPNVAYADVQVVTQSRDEAQAVADNSARMKGVLAILKASTIADKDVQTQFYSVEPVNDYRTSPPTLTGYQANNTVRVTIKDIAKVGIILDRATRAGATNVSDVSFDVLDRQQVEGDALALAVADARRKADLMAGSAGVTLGRIVSVTDNTPIRNYPQPLMMREMTTTQTTTTANPTQIEPQLIPISADAVVVYSIERSH